MVMSNLDDAALLSRVALRDRAAFRELYTRTSGRLLAIALSMLGNRAQAEDLLQDAYVKVWYAADTFDSVKGEPIAWLIAIVRNLAIDRLRSAKPSSSEPIADEQHVPSLDDENARLADCLNNLEVQQRQSIFAAFFQGLSHSEIASRFSEPIGTIKSRVRRGLAALKGCMEA